MNLENEQNFNTMEDFLEILNFHELPSFIKKENCYIYTDDS